MLLLVGPEGLGIAKVFLELAIESEVGRSLMPFAVAPRRGLLAGLLDPLTAFPRILLL
jgi:hypothetical protein